jgi:hypothetical protein
MSSDGRCYGSLGAGRDRTANRANHPMSSDVSACGTQVGRSVEKPRICA